MSFFTLNVHAVNTKLMRVNNLDYRVIHVNASGFGFLRLNKSWRFIVGNNRKTYVLKNVDSRLISYALTGREYYFLGAETQVKIQTKETCVQPKHFLTSINQPVVSLNSSKIKSNFRFNKIKLKFHYLFKKHYQE